MASIHSSPNIFSPVFNSPDEVCATFAVRMEELQQILASVRSERLKPSPQHYLIVGPAGTGKTTLLLRLLYEIKTDPDLKSLVLPVFLDGGTLVVRRTGDFWGGAIAALTSEHSDFFDLARTAKDSTMEPLELLRRQAREKGIRLLLLVDNLSKILGKLPEEDRTILQQTFSSSPEIKIIAASSTNPHFDSFKVITIGDLDRREAVALLDALGKTYGPGTITGVLEKRPERFEVLWRLMGSTPRTVVQIFSVLVHSTDGSPTTDLETILDGLSPYYRLTLDSLAAQEQSIVTALVMNWDGMSSSALAKQLSIESKTVASQLNQLEKKEFVSKIRTSTRNHLYRISDRLWNIHSLLRPGANGRRSSVLWFLRFLELWCRQRQEHHLPFCLFHAPSSPLLVRTSDNVEPTVTVSGEPMEEAYNEVVDDVRSGRHLSAAQKLIDRGFPPEVVWSMLGDVVRDELRDFGKAEAYYKIAAEKGEQKALLKLALLYDAELHNPEKAEAYFQLATAHDDADALVHHAASYFEQRSRKLDALRIIRKAFAANPTEENAFGMVMILLWNDEISEAKRFYHDKFDSVPAQREVTWRMVQMLLMFLAKRQYQFVSDLFKENSSDILEKYKPVYFGMLSMMGEPYADRLKEMGPEFEETVSEIVAEVERVERTYI